MMFGFNAQHDCIAGRCKVTQQGPAFFTQERAPTTLSKPAVIHSNEAIYILNIHALHNSHLVRKVLSRNLTKPIPVCANHKALRTAAAARLRVIGPERRAMIQKKKKETIARKKQAAAAQNSTIALVPVSAQNVETSGKDSQYDSKSDSDELDSDEIDEMN
jgi:hypothetical protein